MTRPRTDSLCPPDVYERMMAHQASRIMAGLEPLPLTPEKFLRMERDAERTEREERERPARRARSTR